MPISSQVGEVPSERLTPSAINTEFAQAALLIGILLLESDLATLSDRARLLTDTASRSDVEPLSSWLRLV